MGKNLVEKIFSSRLLGGKCLKNSQVHLRVDQALTQDATGTFVYLQFEAMKIDRIRIPLAVSYVDHNTLQSDYMNADDHAFLQSAARRYGAYFSRPGNGICHQVHLERFAFPGGILVGSDSHTPTAGGAGMIAVGTGGLEVAAALAGEGFYLSYPEVVQVKLTGKLKRPWVASMDIILEVLRRVTAKGGKNRIFEYAGSGISDLSLTERATITNMGAELGATTSIFPSDDITHAFLRAQKREKDFRPLSADPDAAYDDMIEISLDELEPMVARPHNPDNVVKLKDIEGLRVDQVCVGSCTNSSYAAMRTVARILSGKTISEGVGMTVSPGSKQVYEMLAADGSLEKMVAAGARILESACGPCIGMGQAPRSGAVSLRSFNRNFKGRSGTETAAVYLCNPFVAALAALHGKVTLPDDRAREAWDFKEPEAFAINDNMLMPPFENGGKTELIKGPNIKDVPVNNPLENTLDLKVILKAGDNISTDDIMPAGSRVLPLRSNIPEISKFVFYRIDPGFHLKAGEAGVFTVIGGENYGQGSSREHAAIAPMYLGLRAVIVKSIARIHRSNLINFGILPLEFKDKADYDGIGLNDRMVLRDILSLVQEGCCVFTVENKTSGSSFKATITLAKREAELLRAGGLLPFITAASRK